MIGDLLYEGKGKLVGLRLLNADEYKIEHTMLEEGKFKDIEITLVGTFWTIPAGKNVTYVEGQGIITTKDNEDTATFRGYGIGTSKGQVSVSTRGSVIYKSSSTKKIKNETIPFLLLYIFFYRCFMQSNGSNFHCC